MKFISRLCLAVLVSLSCVALAQQQQPTQAEEDRVKAQQQRSVTQPGNNAPMWRDVRSGPSAYTTSTVQGRETDVLIQSWGETWRQIRNGPVTFYGGWLVVLVLAAIAAFYFVFGSVKLHGRPSGRLIRRFSSVDQVVHWTVAISFCVLGLSGLIMLFGKHVVLPLMGYTLFAWLAALSKNLHNFVAPVFMVSVAVFAILFVRHNLPRAYDFVWFRNALGYVTGKKHVPSGKFNAGEKLWFWGGVVVLSIVVSWSGLILLFPNFDQTRAVMQDAWIWHAAAALLYIAMSLGHIYMGTIGVEGAYGNMRNGYTDETWAKEHHSIWYDEVRTGRHGAGGAVPVGAPHMREKA